MPFFGNTAGRASPLTEALGRRALFGFPAADGIRDRQVIKYVLIRQQKTTLGEPGGARSPRVQRLQAAFGGTGFPAVITADIDGWLFGHAAFIVPIAFALYRNDTDATQPAGDPGALRLMGRGYLAGISSAAGRGHRRDPRQSQGSVPADARGVHRPVRAAGPGQPRGELWFAAHSRTVPGEMNSLSHEVRACVADGGNPR